MNRPLRFMVVAGEVSGDMHAARLVQAIRRIRPDAEFFGIGGDELRRAGMTILRDAREMAVMGLTEVLARIGFFWRVFRDTLAAAREQRPDAVILVDYPGFNLRFAARVHRMGIKVIYYICPQVWAWNRSRIPAMARHVDHLLAIFPFEPKIFEGTSLRADYVGHPLFSETENLLAAPPADLPWPAPVRIALLPGSRPHEVARILPPIWRAAGIIESRLPDAGFIVAAPSKEIEEQVRHTLAGLAGGPTRWAVVSGRTREVLRQARGTIVASGTASLEAALLRCPAVIVYRTAWLTYALARMLVRIPHIGIVNVIAGRRVCPELIQRQATPAALAAALEPLLREGTERAAMLDGYAEVARKLGPRGAEERAAQFVLDAVASPV